VPDQRVILEDHRGKACALNQGIAHAGGQIIFFVDVRQQINSDALRQIVSYFADPTVGCVSGELMLESANTGDRSIGLYWKIEKLIRKMESDTGSVVGATGAIYAVRRELIVPLPPGTLLDDLYIPMHVVRQGKRVLFCSKAIAYDFVFSSPSHEFRRKVRTLTGHYQLLQLAPWLLYKQNSIRFEFVSHKLLRLVIPFALVFLLVSCLRLAGPVFQGLLLAQILMYGLALAANFSPALRLFCIAGVAHTFVMLNAAATVAFLNFMTGRQKVWAR
jgi:cellulose synthase/poly-beta-1,6-N-acetylglucosamine synthase-like glycosyltransferase